MTTFALRRPTLELPTISVRDFRPPSRRALEDMIESLIALLDDFDGDCEDEGSYDEREPEGV